MNVEMYLYIVLAVLVLSLLLVFYRFLVGPTVSDRVVALDALTTVITAGLVLLGYLYQRYIYVDVALIYAVLGFIGVLAIARYIEGGL